MSGFSSGKGGPGSAGEGTVREGGSDEEEEQLVSVQIVAAFFVSWSQVQVGPFGPDSAV